MPTTHPPAAQLPVYADFPSTFVRRPGLVRRLAESADASLAVIVAPPGYGKSALLREWAEHEPRPFVWLKLSEGPRPTEEALLEVLRGVRERHSSFVLAFDDAHVLPASLLRKTLGPFLRELPPSSVVAVASRVEPALPIGRLRAHRELIEVRMRDLAMTPAEGASLLRRAGLKLDFDDAETLVRKTEGWPAALYLAALSLGEEPHRANWDFGGDDHLLVEFVRDEVLAGIPAELAEFVMRTAVLDELSGPLCDQVLGEPGSALALTRLEKTTELLIPLDRAHGRYRWQGLFADAMRAELRWSEPDLEPRLLRHASAWYAGRGDTDRAIANAVAAGDARRVGHLLWSNILSYMGHGRADLVEQWLGHFSHDRIAGQAPLALSAAHNAIVSGKLDQAQHWTVLARAAIARGPGRGGPSSLDAGLAIVEALIAHGGAAQMRDAVAAAHALEPDGSPWQPVLWLLGGVSEHLLGEREAAQEMLQHGADLSALTAPSIASLCAAVSVMIALERDDWERAAELADRAEELLRSEQLTAYPVSALAFAATAAVRAHQGRVDEAKRDLRRGTDLLAELGDYIPWYGADARILLAHASLWLADVVGARTLLAEASRLARKTPDAVIFSDWFDRAWAYMDTLAETSLSGPSSLTIAELRILRFLPSHRSFREIAGQLGVSANTVKTQAHAVYRKLGAASRSEAVVRASEAGLLGQ